MKLTDYTDQLWAEGDSVEVEDGLLLRLKIEPDFETSIEDFDCYGKIAPVTGSRYGGKLGIVGGFDDRPDGFDGGAEIISGRDGRYWWQPPTDIPIERGSDEWRKYRQSIADLIEFGFVVVAIQVCDGTDYFGNPIVVDVENLCGVDSIDSDYVHTIVTELLHELNFRWGEL